ncbi:MAG: hypothetical protein U0441_08160 [Polyangiaceae bacterium]
MRRSVLCAVVLAGAIFSAAPARAGEAEDHFAKGNAAFEAEKYEAALTEYQAAWKVTKVYDLAAIMGQAEMRLGKYKDAAEHFAYALRTFPLTGDEELRKNTETSLAEVKKQIATIRVKAFVKDVTIKVGSVTLASDAAGNDVYLDPGKTTVEASAPGYRSEHKTLDLKAGDNQDVTLTLQPDTGARSPIPGYVLGGVGVAGVILGAALVGAAEGKKGEAQKLHDELGSVAGCQADPTKCKALKDASTGADALGNTGVVAFVFGGVAAAAAGLYFVLPARKSQAAPAKTGVTIVPVVSASSGGALITGAF